MENKREQITEKVEALISDKLYTKEDIARALNVTRQTIYNRLRDKNWKGVEINIINEL